MDAGIPTTRQTAASNSNVSCAIAAVSVPDSATPAGPAPTGSGIGPTPAHLLTPEPQSGLVWVTRDPLVTHGEGLVNETMEAQPDALIWDTDKRGKRPDVLRSAHAAYLDSGAEAFV